MSDFNDIYIFDIEFTEPRIDVYGDIKVHYCYM